jgi:hypothetical protein
LAGTDQARVGVNPGGDLSGHALGRGDQLHQIHEPSGKRVRHEKVVPGLGPVDKDDPERL